jgi:hypothetical protein
MSFAIKETIQDCNLNFLLGSGLSSPYLKTLGKIEALLTMLEEASLPEDEEKILRCSLYRAYFDGVMAKNCNILENDADAEPVLGAYEEFLRIINAILLKRKSTILSKEVNLFTTNIDIFLEKAVERIGLECNDGFSGRFNPWFTISNFKKSHFRRSPQYDNLSELPTVNLLKLHGSLTWQLQAIERIGFSVDLGHVRSARTIAVTPALLLPVDDGAAFDTLTSRCKGNKADATVDEFLGAYDALPIVNPTKAKFRETLLNQTHYELLRIYSNELEKENTVLFAMGFSFADEHIREITLRAANSNPTLMIYAIAYDSNAAVDIRARLPRLSIRNDNIVIVGPLVDSGGRDTFKYDLPTTNKKILREVLDQVEVDNSSAPAASSSA